MIGDKEAFRNIFDGYKPKDVFVLVGDAPDWFDPKDQDKELPMIYTEQNRPKPFDLGFLKGLRVHLIHSKNASDEFYYAWYSHVSTLGIKTLVALDSENEIYVS